jgi:hypothetical protein
MAQLARAEDLFSGCGILGSGFAYAGNRQHCNENKSSHLVLLFWVRPLRAERRG